MSVPVSRKCYIYQYTAIFPPLKNSPQPLNIRHGGPLQPRRRRRPAEGEIFPLHGEAFIKSSLVRPRPHPRKIANTQITHRGIAVRYLCISDA